MPDPKHKKNGDEPKGDESKVLGDGNHSQLVLKNNESIQPKAPDSLKQSRVEIYSKEPPIERQDGLIKRARTSCVSFFQRCFGRATR